MRTLTLLGLLALALPAGAARVPGGGAIRTDCYAEFDVAHLFDASAGTYTRKVPRRTMAKSMRSD